MPRKKPTLEILVPIFLLLAIWLVYAMQLNGLGAQDCFGILPRQSNGLRGILLAPLFHNTKSFDHIINNSVPLAVLLYFVFAVYKNLAFVVLVLGWIATGFLVWTLGDFTFLEQPQSGCHIGASGIVYLLASFLFFSGWIRKSVNTAAIALIVSFLYGSMIWGIFPESILKFQNQTARISWESHLTGLLVGLFFAYGLRNYGPKKEYFSWQQNNPNQKESEQELWQAYLDSLPEGEEPKTYEQHLAERRQEYKPKSWNDLL